MGSSIHPNTIQEVKEKADIVDVISEHVVLKKRGKEYVGICPFHDDSKRQIPTYSLPLFFKTTCSDITSTISAFSLTSCIVFG